MNISYQFVFDDGTEKSIGIELDTESLEIISKTASSLPDWVLLENCRCQNCTLNKDEFKYCPIALNISEAIDFFRNYYSYDEVTVTVKTDNRDFFKRTSIQEALSSLLGIYMVASGCPHMKKLKPMIPFHLPFASVEETLFRATGTYLLGQYFLYRQGKRIDLDLNDLVEFYEGIQQVNQGMANRIRTITAKDAMNNAVICLDIFAQELPYAVKDGLEDIKPFFRVYWTD